MTEQPDRVTGSDAAATATFRRSFEAHEIPLLVARGEIDVYTSPDFRRELQALVAGAATTGRGRLLGGRLHRLVRPRRVRRRAEADARAGGEIVLRGITPPTRKVFDITGLTGLFTIEA